jgi:streptogramin lyase
VKDPGGKEWLVLTNMNEATHCELIFVDYANNTSKTFTGPAGQGAWSLNVVPGDRLVVGTYYDGDYLVFDLKQMAFTHTVPVPGEGYIWSSALGSDGRLYGGTYPGAHLAALDLETYKIEDLGNPVPPNHYLRNVSALPDGRLYCHFMMDKPAHMIFDPKTKKFTAAPEGFEHIDTGVAFDGYFLSGASFGGQGEDKTHVFKGDTLEPVANPPFPIPSASGGAWTVDVYASNKDAALFVQGKTIWRCRTGATQLEKVFEGEHKSRVIDQTPDGKLLLVRGQDYAVLSPGEKEIKLVPIPAEKGPRPALWLRVDPQGRAWGGPTFGQTVFYTDPKTKQTINTGGVCDSGGEVYDAAFANGKTYLVAYSGGDIIEFDPSQPWDQFGNKNPRTLHHLMKEGYDRPAGGCTFGPDGKLYSGWMAEYGRYGGAIAITDPASGKTELIENPFGKQAIGGVAVDDKYIYAGTNLDANGLPPQGGVPMFGMIDRETHKVVFQETMKGSPWVGHMFCDGKTGKLVVEIGGAMHVFDPASRQWLSTPSMAATSIVGTGDGKVEYVNGTKILQTDLSSGATETLAELPAGINQIAVGKDGAMFAMCGTTLYSVGK